MDLVDMDLVATALATGAAAGLTGISCGVVTDSHAALREAVRRRLTDGVDRACGGYGVRVLDAYETDPDLWRTRLLKVLASEVEMDEEIRAAAYAVLHAHRRTGHLTGEATRP